MLDVALSEGHMRQYGPFMAKRELHVALSEVFNVAGLLRSGGVALSEGHIRYYGASRVRSGECDLLTRPHSIVWDLLYIFFRHFFSKLKLYLVAEGPHLAFLKKSQPAIPYLRYFLTCSYGPGICMRCNL